VFCHRFNEEDDDLGMLQAISRPPSKPIAPGDRVMVAVRGREIKLVPRTPADARGR